MGKRYRFAVMLMALVTVILVSGNQASASSSYYSDRSRSGIANTSCADCHGATSTCNGCHAHGVHSSSAKSDLKLTAATDKASYQAGDPVSVTVNGGYRTGWVRVILYNGDPTQGGTELARSSGPNGTGGGPAFPITLQVQAPTTPGTYTFYASWYGNQYDKSGGNFGAKWRPDPNNQGHGEEIVAVNAFDVVSTTPPPTPAISVTDSVAPTTDLQVPFGSVTAGSSANQTVTVTNSGNAALTVGAVGSTNPIAAPFSITNNTCSNQTIAPSVSCTMRITFAPVAAGTFSDSFNIPSNDPAKASVIVNISGAGAAAPTAAISVTDSVAPATDLQVHFGSVTAGSSASQTVTVTNSGTASLVMGAVGSTNPITAPFSITNNTCSNQTIAPAASCTMTIAFAPVAAGTFSDSFNIPSNDPAKASVIVNISGTGAAAPTAAISVTDSVAPTTDLQVPFGSVTAGSSANQTVTVTNSGNAALTVGAVGSTNPITAPFSITNDMCSNQAIAPSASCTMRITFAPVAAGTFSDGFNIPSSDPAKASVIVNISGTGATAALGDITVTDPVTPVDDHQIPFGTVREGRSVDDVVTVTNAGSGQLVMGPIGLNNTLAGPFSIAADLCSSKTLAAGGTCTITVRFAPPTGCANASGMGTSGTSAAASVNTCTYSDSFDIPSDDPDMQVVTVQVSGSGVSNSANNNPRKPKPRYPANLQKDLETTISMQWEEAADPDGDVVSYELRLATDQAFSSPIVAKKVATGTSGTLFAGTGAGFIVFGIAFMSTARGRKGLLLIAVLTVLVGTALVGCGASGINGSQPSGASPALVSRQVSGLQTSTTYYWKVIATDGNGGVAESDVMTFTTK